MPTTIVKLPTIELTPVSLNQLLDLLLGSICYKIFLFSYISRVRNKH